MILAVSDTLGPVQQLSTTGQIGIFRRLYKETQSVISFTSMETGFLWKKCVESKGFMMNSWLMSRASMVWRHKQNKLSAHYARSVAAQLLEYLSNGMSPSSIWALAGVPQPSF
ncbi:hypothetical protein ABG067_006427 [Albugo candida]